LNQFSTAVSTPAAASVGNQVESSTTLLPEVPESRCSNFVTPSPKYAAIFSAALSAATTAAMQNGISVLTPEQTAAVAAAAAAAANEAMRQYDLDNQVQPRTSSAPVVNEAAVMRSELKKFKKGFSSSPALLSFFDDSEEGEGSFLDFIPSEESFGRPRADSDPGLRVTEKLMEEIRKLWILPEEDACTSFGTNDPLLSASHVTLEAFNFNID